MPEGLALALQTQGLIPVLFFELLAGICFGFTGFGAALIFVPLATIYLPPPVVIGILGMTTVASLFTVLAPAWREADRPRVLWMLIPAFACLTPGVWLLGRIDATPLRWIISTVILISLTALIAGWRRRVEPKPVALVALGAGSGLVGGLTGLTGPLVILFNLAGREDVRRTRANTLSFLTLLGLLTLPQLAFQGLLTAQVLWLGLIAMPVYGLGTLTGRWLFDPRHERLFRTLGYLVIAGAVIVGLPVWG